jgi:methylglutaconyl-CoA hydratase
LIVESPSSDDAHVLIDRDDRGVVTLTLNRPEVRNAFGPQMMRDLIDAFDGMRDDAGVRAVVITGSGSAFSAGADLTWMSGLIDNSFDEHVEDSRGFERMLRAVDDAPMPVLARVNGHAMGGAAGLLGCVDIAIAVRGAKLGFTETMLGLAPAMISAYVQPKIGVANARRYFLTGERFDADAARAMGLVNEVCEPDELDTVFTEVVGTVLAAGPQAQRATKRLVRDIAASSGPADSEQLRVELISRLRVSDEAQARMRFFLDGVRG